MKSSHYQGPGDAYLVSPIEHADNRGRYLGHSVALMVDVNGGWVEGGSGYMFWFPRRAALLLALYLVMAALWPPRFRLWWWRWRRVTVEPKGET